LTDQNIRKREKETTITATVILKTTERIFKKRKINNDYSNEEERFWLD
jgi:hypothetical protein